MNNNKNLIERHLYYEDQYLKVIIQRYKDRVTPKYTILNKTGEVILGEISWYGAWRKFCFFPADLTVWDSKCINSILELLNKVNDERKSNRK